MTDFTVCRVCLADNIRVHSIANTELQDLYENLTKTKIFAQDDWPVTLCYICHAQLQKCIKFADLAKHSESLLLQLYLTSIKLTQNTIHMLDRETLNYSTTPVESLSLIEEPPDFGLNFGHNENVCNGKNETETLKQEPLDNGERYMSKVETDNVAVIQSDLAVCDDNIASSDSEDNIASSDSEDNIPLTTFQEPREIDNVKVERKENQKREYEKDIKTVAQEVFLTPEQQTAELLARSKSVNYLISPFKCQLCYKGFTNEVTFSNHTQKHDERSGGHKCEVCSLRYEHKRQLTMHRANAHQRRYRCNKCEHVSRSVYQARDHDKLHEGFAFECKLCSKQFCKRTTYLSHVRKNHSTEIVCVLCGLSFVSHLGLLLHKSKMHKLDVQEEAPNVPESERFCAKCDIQFVCLDAYQRHLLSSVKHSPGREYRTTCYICQQNHQDPDSLRMHMKVHKLKLLPTSFGIVRAKDNSTLAKLSCDLCGAMFINKSGMAAHIRRKHYGVKPSKSVCEVCGQQFACHALLQYHLRRHRGERPFPCARCGKHFAAAEQLKAHARTHSGERPYACRACAKRFAQKGALNRHQLVHTGAKPYPCHLCSKSFSQSNSRNTHVLCVHHKMTDKFRKRKKGATTKYDCPMENKDV